MIHPHWQQACAEAEQALEKNLPTVFALRNSDPEWQTHWPPHRALQICELSNWCLENQPKVILELGSGWTTWIMARYAAEFAAQLVTVEENADWQARTAKLLPQWASVQWWSSQTAVEKKTVYYRSLPDLPEIDLLYVDGPASPLASLDALRLAATGVRPTHVLFDMRHAAVDEFRAVEGYGFELGGSYDYCKPWYLRPLRHHSWFWRK